MLTRYLKESNQKIKFWVHALKSDSFFCYGEIGNITYTIGKNLLDGTILYAMFTMAETEFKVAAILGVMSKYVYPMITVASSIKVSTFIDKLESFESRYNLIKGLITGMLVVAIGQALGAVFFLFCYPPLFNKVFVLFPFTKYILITLFLFHHICDGSAQVLEGRMWFKIIELTIRKSQANVLAENFWSIHIISQNTQLVLGLVLLWGTTMVSRILSSFMGETGDMLVYVIVFTGFFLTFISKFILPLAWKTVLGEKVI